MVYKLHCFPGISPLLFAIFSPFPKAETENISEEGEEMEEDDDDDDDDENDWYLYISGTGSPIYHCTHVQPIYLKLHI